MCACLLFNRPPVSTYYLVIIEPDNRDYPILLMQLGSNLDTLRLSSNHCSVAVRCMALLPSEHVLACLLSVVFTFLLNYLPRWTGGDMQLHVWCPWYEYMKTGWCVVGGLGYVLSNVNIILCSILHTILHFLILFIWLVVLCTSVQMVLPRNWWYFN